MANDAKRAASCAYTSVSTGWHVLRPGCWPAAVRLSCCNNMVLLHRLGTPGSVSPCDFSIRGCRRVMSHRSRNGSLGNGESVMPGSGSVSNRPLDRTGPPDRERIRLMNWTLWNALDAPSGRARCRPSNRNLLPRGYGRTIDGTARRYRSPRRLLNRPGSWTGRWTRRGMGGSLSLFPLSGRSLRLAVLRVFLRYGDRSTQKHRCGNEAGQSPFLLCSHLMFHLLPSTSIGK